MQIDLRDNKPDDDTLEYVFGYAGESLLYDKNDAGFFYIEDADNLSLTLGVGDIDLLITALQKMKEAIDNDK